MFSTKLITDQKIWEDLLHSNSPQIFLQAWQYSKFLESYGDNAFFIGVYNSSNHLIGGSLVAVIHARRGNFYYLPYGPILPEKNREQSFQSIHNFLINKADQDKVNFIRISPFWTDNSTNKNIFKNKGYINAPMHMLAETTWILPLNKPKEELLKSMKQNHRNLIRRAEREGVQIIKSTEIEKLKNLNSLLRETADRHKFTPFSLKYMTAEFNAFQPDNAIIYEAHYQNQILGSAVIFFYGDTAVYRHSGSSSDPKYRKIPANYAIQWQVIQDAINKQCKYYNFWGIAPDNAPKSHPFKGITHFKKGFNGEQIDLIHCQDYPINKKYWFNWGLETFRRIKRGF